MDHGGTEVKNDEGEMDTARHLGRVGSETLSERQGALQYRRKILCGAHFVLACRGEPCILQTRTGSNVREQESL